MPRRHMIYIERDSCRVCSEEQHNDVEHHDDRKYTSEVPVLMDSTETMDN